MAHKIAAPAETLRRLAGDATRAANEQEEKGHPHIAADLRKAAEEAYDAAAGRSASLVAIKAEHASAMAAHTERSSYSDGLATMLRHQNYWSKKD